MIKPCPFCKSANTGLDYFGQPAWHLFIKCHNCGAKGPPQFKGSASGIIDLQETNNAAIQAWNQRSTLDEDYILPCDVKVYPATTITKGCKLGTLLKSIKLRESEA